MREAEKLIHRIPSLGEHLGDGARGDHFKEFVGAVLAAQRGGLTPAEEKYIRILETFMVACVEQMNREAQRDPTPKGIAAALSMWARAAGYTTVMGIASVAADDAPLRRIARTFSEEFKIGAKMAADQVAEQQDGGFHGA